MRLETKLNCHSNYKLSIRKDILNSISCLNHEGVIILHDCLPSKIWNQIVPQIYGHWNGDVWKAIVESRKSKYMDVYTCYADYGIGVIIKRPNRNLLDNLDKDSSSLKFHDYFHNHKNLPIVYGKFTAKEFTSFLKIIRQSKLNYNNINEIFFYPSGRIDIKNKDNLTIKSKIRTNSFCWYWWCWHDWYSQAASSKRI